MKKVKLFVASAVALVLGLAVVTIPALAAGSTASYDSTGKVLTLPISADTTYDQDTINADITTALS